MSDLFNEFLPLVKGMDVSALRHKVIAGNLANLHTPGFIRSDVQFEDLLKEKLRDPSDLGRLKNLMLNTEPQVIKDPSGHIKPDGNNVTIEKETGEITRNTLLFNAYAEILRMKIRALRQVIGSGGGEG